MTQPPFQPPTGPTGPGASWGPPQPPATGQWEQTHQWPQHVVPLSSAGPTTPAARPWFKRKRFVVPAAILAIGIVGSAANGGTSTDRSSVAASTSGTSSAPISSVSTPPPVTDVVDEAATTPPAPVVTTPAPAPTPEISVSQRNAQRTAENYLGFTNFSRSGLIGQLEYEGYSTEDSTWAVDSITIDWNAQAAGSAESYLEFTSFSRSGLVDQLVYEGYTQEQAEFGATSVGL